MTPPTPDEIMTNVHKSVFKRSGSHCDGEDVYEIVYRKKDKTYWRVVYQIQEYIDYEETMIHKDYTTYYPEYVTKTRNTLYFPNRYSGIIQVDSLEEEMIYHGLGLLCNAYGNIRTMSASYTHSIVTTLQERLQDVGYKIVKAKK